MSKELINTILDGWGLPSQNTATNLLMETLEGKHSNGALLDQVCGTLYHFVEKSRPETDDGYEWFWGCHFKDLKGEIMILFPWAQDWEKKDGSQYDRSIAIHTRGEVSEQAIQTLVGNFIVAFGKKLKEREQSIAQQNIVLS